eukprot:SAG11_NODE_865_length_6832_cov_21.731026_2_plen_303_part_00
MVACVCREGRAQAAADGAGASRTSTACPQICRIRVTQRQSPRLASIPWKESPQTARQNRRQPLSLSVPQVLHIISNMSFHSELGQSAAQIARLPLELRIVQDADRLDAIGGAPPSPPPPSRAVPGLSRLACLAAIGIARCFTYGGAKRRALYCDDEPLAPAQRRAALKSKEEYMRADGKADTVRPCLPAPAVASTAPPADGAGLCSNKLGAGRALLREAAEACRDDEDRRRARRRGQAPRLHGGLPYTARSRGLRPLLSPADVPAAGLGRRGVQLDGVVPPPNYFSICQSRALPRPPACPAR